MKKPTKKTIFAIEDVINVVIANAFFLYLHKCFIEHINADMFKPIQITEKISLEIKIFGNKNKRKAKTTIE